MTPLLDGCTIHDISSETAINRWHHPAVAASKDPLAFCACCQSPTLAVLGEDGIGHLVLCSRCKDVDEDQALAIVTRLYAGYPDAAVRAQGWVKEVVK